MWMGMWMHMQSDGQQQHWAGLAGSWMALQAAPWTTPCCPQLSDLLFQYCRSAYKPPLFASRQNSLIRHLCVFIPVLNVPFRTLTLKDPSLHAATDPAVWLRLSPLLYPWTGPRLGQKARVKQRDYRCHSHRGSQTVTQIKAARSWPSVI